MLALVGTTARSTLPPNSNSTIFQRCGLRSSPRVLICRVCSCACLISYEWNRDLLSEITAEYKQRWVADVLPPVDALINRRRQAEAHYSRISSLKSSGWCSSELATA